MSGPIVDAADLVTECAEEPGSLRWLDVMFWAWAMWTILCHAVVAAGGNLQILVRAAVVVLPLGAISIWWGHRRFNSPARVNSAVAETADRAAWMPAITLAAVVLGLGVCGATLATGNLIVTWWAIVGGLALAAVLFVRRQAGPFAQPLPGGHDWLWLVALAGAAWTLVLHRPDPYDDPFYLNLAVGACDAPAAPLFARDTMLGIEGAPLRAPYYAIDALAALVATIAYLTGLPVIVVQHLGVATVAGALLPLAQARLLRRLLPEHWPVALAGTLTVQVLLMGGWDTASNYAFPRLFQGKAILHSVAIPYVIAQALAFAARPGGRAWLALAAAQIGALGLSSTGIWAAPAAAGLALVAWCSLDGRGARMVLLGVSASFYVFVVALVVRQATLALVPPPVDILHVTYQPLLAARLRVIAERNFGPPAALAWSMPVLLLAGWTVWPSRGGRRFAILYLLGFLVLFNPLVFPLLEANVVGLSTNYRIFWVLPVSVLWGVALVSPWWLLPVTWPRVVRATAAAACCVGLSLLLTRAMTFGPNNLARLQPPNIKAPSEVSVAWVVNREAGPGGRFIAPKFVSGWATVFSRHAYPLVADAKDLTTFHQWLGRDEIVLRVAVQRYLAGEAKPKSVQRMCEELFARAELAVVCLQQQGKWSGEIRKLLAAHGFRPVESIQGYEVFRKEAP